MESLSNFIARDSVLANNPNYVWISHNVDINGFTDRLRSSNNAAFNFLNNNSLSVTSIFTFVTAGQVGFDANFTRLVKLSVDSISINIIIIVPSTIFK